MLMDSPDVRCTDTNVILTSPHGELVSAMRGDLRDVSLEQPSRRTAGQRGRWIWAELMNYAVIIITEADFSDGPAFIYPFRANKVEDFEVAVREAIAEWRRYNPNQDFLEAGCTVLVEKAVFSCSAKP
jgi:hypothetical protein